MASSTTYALGALLVASVGFNVRLYTKAPEKAPAPAHTAEPAEAAPRSDGTCERRLAACQQQAWAIAARALGGNQAPKDDPAPVKAPVPEVEAGVDASGAEAQASTLCATAENALREQWQRDGFFIAANLKQSFNNPDEQEQNLNRTLADMRDVAGLDPQQAASLEAAYRDKRAAAVASARAAFDKDPPDMGAVVDAARSAFSDEDESSIGSQGTRGATPGGRTSCSPARCCSRSSAPWRARAGTTRSTGEHLPRGRRPAPGDSILTAPGASRRFTAARGGSGGRWLDERAIFTVAVWMTTEAPAPSASLPSAARYGRG